MLHSAASDLGLHCLPFIEQLLDTDLSLHCLPFIEQLLDTDLSLHCLPFIEQLLDTDLSLHCLPFIEQLLDTSTGSKINLFKFRISIAQNYGDPILRVNVALF